MDEQLKINYCMEKLWIKGTTTNAKTGKLEKGDANNLSIPIEKSKFSYSDELLVSHRTE